MERAAFLDGLEYQLVEGAARWVADFPESIRDVRLGKVDFDLLVKGSTRGRSGYFLSALAARFTLPDYSVAGLARVKPSPWTVEEFRETVDAVHRFMERFQLKWVWLVMGQQGKPVRGLEAAVRGLGEKEMGVALVDLKTMAMVHSSNFLGKNVTRIIPGKRAKALPRHGGEEPRPGRRIQWSRLASLVGAFFIGAMVLSFIGTLVAFGRPAIVLPIIIADAVVAAIVASLYYFQTYHTRFVFDDQGFHLVVGNWREDEARWKDFDLVSLFHTGGGKYHLTLYRTGDHTKYTDVPASSVGLDPVALRWKAMELTAHREAGHPAL